jgi:hypothetical protein
MKKSYVLSAALIVLLSLSACSKSQSPSADSVTTPPPSGEAAASVSAAPTPSASSGEASAPAKEIVPDAQVGSNACKLLTKEMAESVIGKITTDPQVTKDTSLSNCMYLSDSMSAVGLMIQPSGGSSTLAQQSFDASKGISGVDPVRVDGLGDGAYWAGGTLSQMNFFKGGDWVILSVMGAKGDAKQMATDLAKKVLANM